MINEAIKKARKAKGLSQEELAVRLNVVRQTVSKWENSLSVPDADMLLQMAELLEVPVSQLLGAEVPPSETQALTEQLARLNGELAERVRRERLAAQANQKRGLILFLSFLTLPVALAVDNETVSLAVFAVCALAALTILYRNMALLTHDTTDSGRLRPLRAATIFNAVLFVIVIGLAITISALEQSGRVSFTQDDGKIIAMALIIVVMLFFGFISPKLPFNRYTGLRLPWTVRDEDTWNLAHKILGLISLPTALLYLAAALTLDDFVAVSGTTMALYIGIPGVLSLIFYWKKLHGRL